MILGTRSLSDETPHSKASWGLVISATVKKYLDDHCSTDCSHNNVDVAEIPDSFGEEPCCADATERFMKLLQNADQRVSRNHLCPPSAGVFCDSEYGGRALLTYLGWMRQCGRINVYFYIASFRCTQV